MTEKDNTIHEGWATFIENNSERYLQIYEANKDKKVFIHTNWSAFFWLDAWMFYRKMYLWGAILMLSKYLLAFGLLLAMLAAYLPQLMSAMVGEMVQKTLSDILFGKVLFVIVAVVLLVRLAFSLFADCIYREHIRKNIGYKGEGTSVAAVIIAIVASSLVGEVLGMIAQAILNSMLGI